METVAGDFSLREKAVGREGDGDVKAAGCEDVGAGECGDVIRGIGAARGGAV